MGLSAQRRAARARCYLILLLLCWGEQDYRVGGINDNLISVTELSCLGYSHYGGDAFAAGQNGGVGGWSAFNGDQRQHLVQIQQRGIGRSKILCDQDERVPGVGDSRGGFSAESGDDSGGDVVEIGGTLTEIAAESLKCLRYLCESGVDGVFPGFSVLR